jgi:PAS domain S-box-containing protein
VKNQRGQVVLLIPEGRDITELRELHGRLAESENRLRTIIDSEPECVRLLAPDGALLEMNPAGLAMIETDSLEQVRGRSIYPIVSSEYRDAFIKLNQGVFRGESGSLEFEISGLKGTRRWLETLATPLRNPAGEIVAALGITRDVTGRKRAEEAQQMLTEKLQAQAEELELRVAERTRDLSIATDEARAADRITSAFLATMSHELRTPLNSIIGFTGVMRQGLAGPLTEEQSKQLGMVQGSARHLLRLINDILDISKIEAGQLVLCKEPFDLKEAIEDAVGHARIEAREKGLSVLTRVDPAAGRIVSDRCRVEQILTNLLGNAVKFTKKGGVRLECDVDDGQVTTRVVDTGIGIRPEDLERIFQPFQQVDSGAARQHEGTGLGLAICKRLVAMLGGDLSVESDWGKGSTFTLRLPKEG